MTLPTATQDDLRALVPAHDSFVGIDSDGCVFDTMEIKQKQCFHGLIVSHWHLEPIEAAVRQTAEFVNLYSSLRGQNRFPNLIATFDLLQDHPDVLASGVQLPDLSALRDFVESGIPIGNPTLEQAVGRTGDATLASVLVWSQAVNQRVAEVAQRIPPFAEALASMDRIKMHSDAIVVSQTPREALVREWEANSVTHYVRLIAGQELGTKAEHLQLATEGKYAPDRVLMIGDAPGDQRAAEANGALFYPINPGQEEESWKRFREEAYDKFLAGSYAGEYEQRVVAEFQALLPDTPPWETQ